MANLITSGETKYNENALYYFKKDICVNTICKSTVNLFADSRYKMYINGVIVAVGPCKQTSETKYYDVVDITEHIKTGYNIIEVQVLQLSNTPYLQGNMLLESVIRSGGMAFCLWGNVGDVEIASDEDWEVAKEKGVEFFCESFYNFYNVAALSEKINTDYRNNLKFEKAVKLRNVYNLDTEKGTCSLLAVPAVKRTIPMMYFNKKKFIDKKKDIYDAGELTCGYVRFKCTGKGNVRITYAECMSFIENGGVKKRKRDDENGVIVGNYDVLKVDGECVFEPFWMRVFRYIEVKTEGNIQVESFDYIETGYPLNISDKYDFGNNKDNRLFDISVNTLKRCMHETYMDCPYYEQIQYAMDTHLQMLFTYQLTDDRRLPKKAIDDFAKSYRVGNLTQSRYPSITAQYIPGFSLFFILMLYEHSKRFNDKSFIRKYIHIADGIIDWFEKRLEGYMVSRSNLWDFVDWSKGYDFGQIPEREPMAVYSLMLAYVLEKTSEMHNMLGNKIPNYMILADKIKEAVHSGCYDEKSGLYADSPGKTHFAQHPQIWAVLCGMEKGDRAKNILLKSINLECKATSAYMFFLFRALEKAGIYDHSEECMDSLRSLVELGCTTTPEWVGEDVRSECHAWSAVAIYEFTAKVLGVTYEDNCINIKPYIKGRENAKGEVATPVGMVYCEWKICNGVFSITIKLPENQKAVLTLPDSSVLMAESGEYSCEI